tara:strand:- start:774 stop:899 length:126 start_codon:yes stop_codon:yes gene_type:complete
MEVAWHGHCVKYVEEARYRLRLKNMDKTKAATAAFVLSGVI